jgi:Zn-dependent peptidase ImmA (M78 family)
MINTHKYLDPFQKREVLFHELGHLLRHDGDQTEMTHMFRDWQERDAKRFTRYAATPYHMLRFIDFSLPRQHILLEMKETFRVSEKLCQERLEQTERNTRKNYAYINEVKTWTLW